MQLLLHLRPGERVPLALAFGYFFFVLASYYVLRPIRDAMGIAGGVDDLPWLFTATLVATALVGPPFAALVARLPRRRFATWSYRSLMLCLLGFYAALVLVPDAALWIGRGFYVFVSVFNLFAVSLFWAVMADCFRSEDARRLFGIIAAGGTLGSILGGAVTGSLAGLVGDVPLLLVSVVLLELALRCMRALTARLQAIDAGQRRIAEARIGGGALAGFAHVARSPYLLGICGFMLLYTIGSTFLYFMQAGIVADAFSDRAARVAFFARIDVWVGIATLLAQLLLTGRILARIGVGWTLALLPLVSVVGFVALGIAPVLSAVIAFQVARRTVNFALSRPSREILFVPLSREDKYKAKNVIDTFVYRAGDQIGAWASAGLAALGLGIAGVAMLAAPLAAVWLLLALWLGRANARLRDADPAHELPVPVPSTVASTTGVSR